MGLPVVEKMLGSRKAEAVFLAAACLCAALYRGWGVIAALAGGVPDITHISYDGVYYAQIAKNLLDGHGPGWEAMVFPVLQPVIVAVFSRISGIQNLSFLAVLVNQLAGALLLIPAYYLAKEYFGIRPAVATVAILIPYPHLVAIAGGDTVESLYAFLTFLSLLLAYRAISDGKKTYLAAAGACMGATYLARPEGLNLFVVFMAVAGWQLTRRAGLADAAKKLGLALAMFVLLALPYAWFLADSYGRVVLSPKLPYESVVMKTKVYGLPMKMSEVDGLTPGGKLAWQEKGGAGLVVKYFTDDPGRFVRVYTKNLTSELPWNVMNSTHLEGYPIVYPLYFWLPALVSFGSLLYRPDTRWKAALLWAPFVNLLIYPVFTAGFWIYHVPYVPALVMLAAGAYALLSGRLTAKAGFAVPVLLAVTLFWAGYSTYVKYASKPENVEVINYRKALSDEAQKAGCEARARFGTGSTYMMKWSRLVYYLGGRWVCIPVADTDRIIEYGRENGADYVVEELVGDETASGPEYMDTPGLSLQYMYQSNRTQYAMLVWRIEGSGR